MRTVSNSGTNRVIGLIRPWRQAGHRIDLTPRTLSLHTFGEFARNSVDGQPWCIYAPTSKQELSDAQLMTTAREQLVRVAAARGKYAALYRHLLSALREPEWRTTFGEIESILGFRLPDSARLHRPWWSNSKKGSGHSHALAWQAAGWKTREVDLEAEALVFARADALPAEDPAPGERKKFDLDEFWPAIPRGTWQKGFTVTREQIYDEFGRLTGGPQVDAGDGC